ncbi:glycosyltransferase family 4 protein [Brevibacillus brevis]|uniref:Glycosyltransferase family 4 protein n=1 Tax=Brevibacillus brevis TaxID=1393 RepID=A0ABY9T025_BREBE|nr:glycosyltransferase family 4 protein [Brevibacillus brevis]WNC13432.1 glycosyltransferase family 4 protein [Brevibacillus brevis]
MTVTVLMVLDSMGAGGTETHVLSVGKPFAAKGAKLHVAGADGPFHQEFVRAGFRVHLVEAESQPLEARRDCRMKAFRQVMEREGVTIVHVHQTPSGLAAASAARSLGIPVVFTMHGTYYPPGEALELAEMCDAIISVSKPVQGYWRTRGIESSVISNGVDPEAFRPVEVQHGTPRILEEIPQHATVVTYVSRLAWQKASVCNMVLRSTKSKLPELENVHIVVVGTGAQAHHVTELARALNKLKGERYIHIAGEQTDVRPFYARSDLVIGTGRVALEAMACGKPVLAIGNHGYFGMVTPDVYSKAWDYYFGDHDSIEKPSPHLIAQSLRAALRDRGSLKRIGAQAREWIASEFAIEQKAGAILDLYERVQNRKKGEERS